MADYLLDTNHASQFLSGTEPIKSRVESARNQGDRFGVSMTVVGKLFFAVEASQRRRANLQRLQEFLDDVLVWEFDLLCAREFGRIQATQKAKGRPIPSADAQIAAVGKVHNLIILTGDHHFSLVDGITTENWLI